MVKLIKKLLSLPVFKLWTWTSCREAVAKKSYFLGLSPSLQQLPLGRGGPSSSLSVLPKFRNKITLCWSFTIEDKDIPFIRQLTTLAATWSQQTLLAHIGSEPKMLWLSKTLKLSKNKISYIIIKQSKTCILFRSREYKPKEMKQRDCRGEFLIKICLTKISLPH